MANDPAFLFYPGDYLRDTQCLSEKTQVAYDRIMCEHMRNICISQAQLKFFTKRLTDDEVEELMSVLTKSPEGFSITWVVDSINKRREYSESRRNNRKSKPVKEVKNNNNISSSYVKHMDNENEIENEIDKIFKVDPDKKSELIDALVVEFGFTEMKFSLQKKNIFQFVTNLEFTGQVDHFTNQFRFYKEWKELSGEKKHSFQSLIGTPAMQFTNCAWNNENWQHKIEQYKADPANQSKFDKLKTSFDNVVNPYL